VSGGVVLSWSGGKDSALALWTMREELGVEPAALLTTVNEDHDRISIHGVRRELLRAQAEALGLPSIEVGIPTDSSNDLYEERLEAALAAPPLDALGTVAFADLFLADIRGYREEWMAGIGRRTAFPLWGHGTAALARRFVDAGFAATLVCVDTEQLDAEFVGRAFDLALLGDLPAGVDPCGENGEFHTFVHAGPIFREPIPVVLAERHDAGRFVYQDLLASV